jgi:hypothetical protein
MRENQDSINWQHAAYGATQELKSLMSPSEFSKWVSEHATKTWREIYKAASDELTKRRKQADS